MALIKGISPTRMELTGLKKRLKTATRGHKLLKDKRDDLMKRFLKIVRENRILRENVEKRIMSVHNGFAIAVAVMNHKFIEEALMIPSTNIELNVGQTNIMSVIVPSFQISFSHQAINSQVYGYLMTTAELDESVGALVVLVPELLKLAETEKTSQLLAEEIEKTRRRVNALEYVQIPSLQETIKSISMKLEENERSNLSRLMKIKDMMMKNK